MDYPTPLSALRELRQHMTHPKVAMALAGVGALLVLVGPFGTAEVMSWPMRISYWMLVPAFTYAIGFYVHAWLLPRLGRGPMPEAITAGVAGLLIVGVIVAVNALLFDNRPNGGDVALLVGITALIFILMRLVPEPASAEAKRTPPALLDRLPLDKRGPLVAISVEDHYVKVRTTRGEEMLLLRLSDAIREVGDTPGLRVHRSHWVATDHVTAAERKGDGAILSLSIGADIPVSRSNMTVIREAGLLPR